MSAKTDMKKVNHRFSEKQDEEIKLTVDGIVGIMEGETAMA